MKIIKVAAREIFDSRGQPTVECTVILENECTFSASVPSGLSRGSFEAVELRDGGPRLAGKGVLRAIENIENSIAPLILNKEPNLVEADLKMIDLDGTENKMKLGANATLAVSMAVARAQAAVEELEIYEMIAVLCDYESVALPFPMFNIINGGMHATNNLKIQEFMVMPIGTQNFRSAFEATTTLVYALKKLLEENQRSTALGDEGGFASYFHDEREALDFIMAAIDNASSLQESEIGFVISLDAAASYFYDTKTNLYVLGEKRYTSDELIAFYESLANQYPIYSIEDGLSENDLQGWIKLTKKLGSKVQIVGDDIFATSADRILAGFKDTIANAAIIKPNQVGTITETLQAIQVCKDNSINTIISHRSGETDDTFIADLAVGTSAGHIKAGSCMRGERVSKYNQLLRIEDKLVFSLLDT